jgi:hypothetical protein
MLLVPYHEHVPVPEAGLKFGTLGGSVGNVPFEK